MEICFCRNSIYFFCYFLIYSFNKGCEVAYRNSHETTQSNNKGIDKNCIVIYNDLRGNFWTPCVHYNFISVLILGKVFRFELIFFLELDKADHRKPNIPD